MKTKSFISVLFLLCFIIISNCQNVRSLSPNNPNSSDSLKNIESVLEQVIVQAFEELKVPGAIIGVFMEGYDPYTLTLGVSDLESKQPIGLNYKMRIGSITKTFTGTVLLQLVDEGKISLSDKLSEYFPDYPNGQNITIQMLGDMRSGLFNYTEDENFQEELLQDLTKPFTPEEVLAISMKHGPYFPPDSSTHYSNTNTVLLGLIIEKITGNPLQTEIQNRILDPLGMKETYFAVDTTFPEPHAHGYAYLDPTLEMPADVTNQDPSWGWSAGAMISTLSDLNLYSKNLATGQLISNKSQEDRLNWRSGFTMTGGPWKGKNLKYGFGIASFDNAIGHNGGIPGFNSFMGYLPEKGASIIVLVNMQDNKEGMGPADFMGMKIVELLNAM